MRTRHRAALRFLRLMVAASIIVPAALFGYVATVEHTGALHRADDQLKNNIDVVQEHVLKVLQTLDRAIGEADEVINDLSEDEIRRREPALHLRLKRITDALPQLQSLNIIGADARPLASSLVSPPLTVDLSERDYFKALSSSDVGFYIGQVLQPTLSRQPFFNVGRRRTTADGSFGGIILASVPPTYFEDFFSRLASLTSDGTTTTILRDDGAVLVRFPVSQRTLGAVSESFLARLRQAPDQGTYVGKSAIDGEDRRAAYRRLPQYPIYVLTSVTESAVRNGWLMFLSGHMIFGVPATLFLFGISLLALQRTKALQAEIEARERAEGALRQAQRLEVIGQLTGGIAHDFNNLLMVILGGVDRIKRGALDATQQRTADMVTAAARRGESLIRHLLTFARRQAISPTPVDVAHFMKQMEEVLHGALKSGIHLEVELPAEPLVIHVDAGELELALLNLAVNARDAMPTGGRLTLAACARRLAGETVYDGLAGEFVAISVADTGAGMSRDVIARAIEPFFTTKPAGEGTGLGLSQVYGFAKQLGGTLVIDSEPGRGSVMTMLFPRIAMPARSAAVARPQHRRGARILLVEDALEVAQVSRDYLERMGHTIEVVGNGTEAVTALNDDDAFDLVLSDIVMPGGLSGLDLALRLRDSHPDLPIILVTGYSESADAAREMGFEVLRKPYNVERLAQAIATHLDRTSPPVQASA